MSEPEGADRGSGADRRKPTGKDIFGHHSQDDAPNPSRAGSAPPHSGGLTYSPLHQSTGTEVMSGSLADELDDEPRTANTPRRVDAERIHRAVREILLAVGEDPDREGLRDTPARIARMYEELFSGLVADPRGHLAKCFREKYDEIVLVRDICFDSICEHHLMPFMGAAHVAYLPNGKVVGLSKLARVVETLARRPQVQERMTEQIADLLMHALDARGVAVILEATHTCMTVRGVRKPGSVCITSAVRGIFKSNLSTRSEVMSLIYGSRK